MVHGDLNNDVDFSLDEITRISAMKLYPLTSFFNPKIHLGIGPVIRLTEKSFNSYVE